MVFPSPLNTTLTVATITITPLTPMPTTPWAPGPWDQKILHRSLKRSAVFSVTLATGLGSDILDLAEISFSDQ